MTNVRRPETPYLLMDLDTLKRKYRSFVHAFPGVQPHYATKCNSDPSVLKLLHALGCGFEIASANELDDLIRIGVDPESVIFSNPVKSPRDIERAASAGVWRFACDSTSEISKIADALPGASIYIRLATGTSGTSDVPSEGKFGVDATQAEQLAIEATRAGLHVYGVAFHVGSQMTSAQAWTEAIKSTGDLLRALVKHDIVVSMVNIGGGFPARYSDNVPAIAHFGSAVTEAINKFIPYGVQTIAEPGRALVAEAGSMISTVIGVAERNGERWAHLDIGAFNGMMEALETQNRLRFPISDSRNSPSTAMFNLTGPSCDSQDTILFDVAMSADLAVGDVVTIGTAGAYTTSYASNFNGFQIPPTICIG